MINRRNFLFGWSATAFGIALGFTGIRLTHGSKSVSLVGKDTSIFALISSGVSYLLVILGDQQEEALRDLPLVAALGNHRVDGVIATHRVLQHQAFRELVDFDKAEIFCIQSDPSLPPLRGNVTTVLGDLEVNPGGDSTVRIRELGNRGVDSLSDHPPFQVTWVVEDLRILLASDHNALLVAPESSHTLIAAPGSPDWNSSFVATATLVAGTHPSDSDRPNYVRLQPTDPLTLRIKQERIETHDLTNRPGS